MSVNGQGDRADGGLLRTLTPADLCRLEAAGCGSLLGHPTWATAAMSEWGFCGLACLDDGVVSGFVLVCPALFIPRDHPLAVGANADAAALLALVDEGCARRLVQSLAARLVGRRRIVAVDAAASRLGTPLAPSYECLGAVGFHPIETDPHRYRLELDGTRSWALDLEGLFQRLRGLVRPAPPPEAVGRFDRSRH